MIGRILIRQLEDRIDMTIRDYMQTKGMIVNQMVITKTNKRVTQTLQFMDEPHGIYETDNEMVIAIYYEKNVSHDPNVCSFVVF